MANLQQQKDEIDKEAQREKDEADKQAALARQAAADAESKEIREQAEYDVAKIQKDAQR